MSEDILNVIKETQADLSKNNTFFINTITKQEQEIKTLSDSLEAIKNNVSDYNSTKNQVEKLEAQLKAMPPVSSQKKEEESPFFKMRKEEDGNKLKYIFSQGENALISDPFVRHKVYNANTSIAGARVGSEGLYTTLYEGNLPRMFATMQMVDAGTFKLPNIGAITFAAEATVNTGRTNQGTLTGDTANVIDTLVAQAEYSRSALQDMPNVNNLVMSALMMGAARKESQDAVTALDAATITQVLSGVSAALPTAANMVARLTDMVAEISSAYLNSNSRWYMSRAAFARVSQSNNTTLNYDPVNRVTTILGYPVYVSDYLDQGNAATHLPVYFGDLSLGLFFATRKDIEIETSLTTNLGFQTYFAYLRSKSVVWQTNALVRMKSHNA